MLDTGPAAGMDVSARAVLARALWVRGWGNVSRADGCRDLLRGRALLEVADSRAIDGDMTDTELRRMAAACAPGTPAR